MKRTVLIFALCLVPTNVSRPDQLPPKGFHVVALPLKLKGGSVGPLRALAIVHG